MKDHFFQANKSQDIKQIGEAFLKHSNARTIKDTTRQIF